MWSYFGHIARRDGDCLEKVIMQGRVEGSRKPGRPRTRWIDQIKSVARSSSLQDLYSLAKDRQRWRAIVDLMRCQSWWDRTNQPTNPFLVAPSKDHLCIFHNSPWLVWGPHHCHKTDFLFAKSQGPQSYFRYTLLNTQWTFCASMSQKIGVFICLHF